MLRRRSEAFNMSIKSSPNSVSKTDLPLWPIYGSLDS